MRVKIPKTKPSKGKLAYQRLLQAHTEGWMYPEKVPLDQRKQVFLPDFTVTLVRTPFMPPRYATFWVPLNFNKLDLKDYLLNMYNVETLKIRSYVEQQLPTRDLPCHRDGIGPLRRPRSKKRMMVELVEPFIWPPEPAEDELEKGWSKEAYYDRKRWEDEVAEQQDDYFKSKEPKQSREMFAEHAKLIREGKQKWRPTWQALGLNFNRPMLGQQQTQVLPQQKPEVKPAQSLQPEVEAPPESEEKK